MKKRAKLLVDLQFLSDILGLPGEIKRITEPEDIYFRAGKVWFWLEGEELEEVSDNLMTPEIEVSYTTGDIIHLARERGKLRAFRVNPHRFKHRLRSDIVEKTSGAIE